MRNLTYNTLMDSVSIENILDLSDASQAVQVLMHATDDEEYITDYSESSKKKMRDIARLFLKEELDIHGDSDDYHNLAVDYSSLRMFSCACMIIERGLNHFQASVDLLADLIEYSTKSGQMDKAEKTYKKLLKVRRQLWNWRAYVFSIQYLNEKVKTLTQKAIDKVKSEVLALSEEFVQYSMKHSEIKDIAYHARSQVSSVYGGEDSEEKVLLAVYEKDTSIAPRCALRLAQIYFEREKFEDSIKYLNKVLPGLSKPQPSFNSAYAYMLRAMCNTSVLLCKYPEGDLAENREQILAIYKDFDTSRSIGQLNSAYEEAIESTIKILEKQSGVKNDEGENNPDFI